MYHIKESSAGGTLTEKYTKYVIRLCVSALLPALVFIFQPLGMTMQQSAVVAVLLLVIIWWCTGWVDKTAASCILILCFLLFSGAPAKTVFAFPLSSTFLLIALTYLFSRGVKNSHLVEKYLDLMLRRNVNTPVKALLFGALMLVATMYIIPQPLARLIIVADILNSYLDRSDVNNDTKSVLIFGVFFIYIFVNMLTMNADIILNTTSVAVAGLKMIDVDWMKYMAIPSAIYTVSALAMFCFVFRRELGKQKTLVCTCVERTYSEAGREKKTGYGMEILVVVTVLLWLTESFHGIPNWAVTLVSIVIMYIVGVLKIKDLAAIDVKMLVFLTAAMSIGGVMSVNGTADCIFSVLKRMIHGGSMTDIIVSVMLITISLHMILGSNTTTVSVVIPGIIYMCSDILPVEVVMFIVYVTSVTQWVLPFHSVGLMMGVSQNCFTAKHVLKVGVPLTAMVFAAIFALYLPWWRLIGVLPS